ncbi:MAG: DUF5991 domain-containing protein [Acidimicrobiia bacterium]|nr:DUF5991 domain-containing protein [Acidimicrobiia bacterium]
MKRPSRRARTLTMAVIAVVVTVGAAVVLSLDDPEDAPVSDPATTTTATSITPATTAPESPTTTDVRQAADPSAWLGTYVWSEFVEGDPGSDQTLVHVLSLDGLSEDGSTIDGTLTQEGFQTYAVMDIRAIGDDQLIVVEFVALGEGSAAYSAGEVLFRLEGEPGRPTTTIESLVTLVPDPDPGVLFEREPLTVETPLPGSVWGVDAETFDLVQIELATGDVLRSVAGWGPDFADASAGGGQALQFVEVEAGSSIWVDDCCEPAFGTTFRIDPDTTNIADVTLKATGLGAELSFDGRLVALGVGDLGISVLDAETGDELVGPDALASSIASPPGVDLVFPTPLTWLSETTLAVAADSVDRTSITFLDLSDPDAPVVIGDPLTIDGVAFDADVRFDGRLVVLVDRPNDTPTKELLVIDVQTRRVLDRIELEDGTRGIDYDATRNHLLIVDGDGMVQVFGKSGLDVPVGPFVDAGW